MLKKTFITILVIGSLCFFQTELVYPNYARGDVFKPYTCVQPPYTCWSNNFSYSGFIGKAVIVAPNGVIIPLKDNSYSWNNDKFCDGGYLGGECLGWEHDYSFFTNEPIRFGKLWIYGYIPQEHGVPPLNENVGRFLGVFDIQQNEWEFNANLERWDTKTTSINASLIPQIYPNPFGGTTYLTDIVITGINHPNFKFTLQQGEEAIGIDGNSINWTTIATIQPNTSSYTVSNLTQAKKYYFRSQMFAPFPNNIVTGLTTPFSATKEIVVSEQGIIQGPASLSNGQVGTWTAIPYADNVPHEWRVKIGSGSWSNVLSTSNTFQYQMPSNNIEVQAKIGPVGESWTISTINKIVACSNCSTNEDGDNLNLTSKSNLLYQNYPNPFNPSTTISYNLKNDTHVKISVYDISGQEVLTLVNNNQKAGYQTITWNGIDKNSLSVASGIYYYKIITDEFSDVKRMILIK